MILKVQMAMYYCIHNCIMRELGSLWQTLVGTSLFNSLDTVSNVAQNNINFEFEYYHSVLDYVHMQQQDGTKQIDK